MIFGLGLADVLGNQFIFLRMILHRYRYHEMDPLQFSDGFRFTWRCGDTINPSTVRCVSGCVCKIAYHSCLQILISLCIFIQGLKCFEADGTTAGHVVGQPTCGNVDSYAWYYSWKANQQ